MRRVPEIPAFTLRLERDRTRWRFAVGSVVVHVVIVFLAIWDWTSYDIPETLTPGGAGPRGGGGGGGGPRVSYVVLPVYRPPPQARPTERAETRPEDLVIPIPTLARVDIETPKFEIPRETAPVRGAELLGRGAGTGGGPGTGTGAGGGIGSGRGTGMGSDVGPGTGGEGGDVFPPALREMILPPQPRPRSVRGKTFVARFTVSAEGRVLKVEVAPRIRDGEYRRRFIAQLYEWSFAPAVTRDGTLVAGEAIVSIDL